MRVTAVGLVHDRMAEGTAALAMDVGLEITKPDNAFCNLSDLLTWAKPDASN